MSWCGVRRSLSVLSVVLLPALLPVSAAAHLYLVSSTPASGVELLEVPREIRLRFSEPAELAFTRIELLGPEGVRVALGEPFAAESDPNVVVIRILESLRPRQYSVTWRTTSADGHPVAGRFDFSVSDQAEGLVPAAVENDGSTEPLHHDPAVFPTSEDFTAESLGYVAVRWLTFVGLLGVIGTVAFKTIILGILRRGRTPEAVALLAPASARSAGYGMAFALLLGLAAAARLYAQSLATFGAGQAVDAASLSTMLFRTTWGFGWVVQAGATALGLLGFGLARRGAMSYRPQHSRHQAAEPLAVPAHAGAAGESQTAANREELSCGLTTGPRSADGGARSVENAPLAGSGPRLGWTLATLAALVLAFTPALSGHAVTTPSYSSLAVVADGLHVLGAGGWLGSLLMVVAVGIPVALRLGVEVRGRAIAALVNAFSPTALGFATLVILTGFVSAFVHLGSVADLWQSDYGRTLLWKVAILALVFATGAYNWLRVRPTLGDDAGTRRLRRSASFELAIATAVLLVTAVLVATPPPPDPVAERVGAQVEGSP